jgi:hypothetical protein
MLLLVFPSSPCTSCGMARRSVRVVEQFICSYPLKVSSDVFLFLGRSANLRNREVRTSDKRRMSVKHYLFGFCNRDGLRTEYLLRIILVFKDFMKRNLATNIIIFTKFLFLPAPASCITFCSCIYDIKVRKIIFFKRMLQTSFLRILVISL